MNALAGIIESLLALIFGRAETESDNEMEVDDESAETVDAIHSDLRGIRDELHHAGYVDTAKMLTPVLVKLDEEWQHAEGGTDGA